MQSVLAPGDRVQYFGDYELVSEIAIGGMGVVWKARQVKLNRTVALKMIRSGILAGKDEVARFHAEAEAAANLQHPNIVAIHEVGEHDGEHFFSMDFVDGKNLAEVCEGKPLPARQAAEFIATIADAVQFAHQRGILHRDLKPQNVMLDADRRPRLTDFGLAKRFGVDSTLTQTGTVVGSPSYMAPEQAQGRADRVGPHSDVYALGAILYELLTGRAPFNADSVEATLVKVASEEPVAPRKANPNVPEDLETICMKCLEKSPQRRYATARDLADDVRRFLKQEPILARPVSAARKVEQWAKRNPMFLAAVAALAFLAVSSVAYWLWQQNQYLVWHAAHPDVTRAAGERTAFVKTLNSVSGWMFLLVVYGFLFFSKRLRGVPLSKMFDAHWMVNRPRPPMSPQAMAVYEIASGGSILFALFYLTKLMDATVWEAYAEHGAFWTIYALLYFGVMILWLVRRERHAQLFGRDTGATDARHVPTDLSDRVMALMRDGTPAAAFKLYRAITGCTMADARTAVDNIAKQNGMPGIPPAKISPPKLALNLALTAAVAGIALYLLSPDLRWPVSLQFLGGWFFMTVTMTALHYRGFAKNGLPRIVAMIGFLTSIGYHSRALPGSFQFATTILGMIAGAALIICSHKSSGAEKATAR
jgi:tRNA A-37 threonylcarbamoyl transferase component Bud32